MTSPELAEEVLDDLEVLRARDPRGLLPAVAGSGAQVRETARLTAEAGLARVTEGGRPRGLVIVARREGAVAASVLSALLGPSSPVTVDVVPGPTLPVWTGPSDIAVVATRTGAGRYAVTPAYEAARRGVSLVGIGAEDAPLRAACSSARAPYVALPRSRVQHTTLWSLLTPLLQLATDLDLLPDGAADPEAIAAALDEVAGECGPAQETFVNPAKTLALELLDALPVIAAEGPLAGAAATRIADQLATLAGLPVTGFRLPDQRVAACAVLGGPLAPRDGADDFFRDRADDSGRRLRLLTIRDTDAGGDDGAGEREPRSAAEAMDQTLRTAAAHNVPVSGLAEHGEPARFARLPRLARQLAVADFTAVYLALALDKREGSPHMTTQSTPSTEPGGAGRAEEEQGAGHEGGHGGTRAIIAALLANIGIAIAKFIAFLVTGASSMLAEAIHSVADSGNQVLLLVGGRQAKRAATPQHPFGFGRDRYIYAFIVSIVLFSVGGLFAIYEGVHKLQHPEELTSPIWAIGVLVVAIVLESFSLRTAVKETNAVKSPDDSYWKFIRHARSPELPVVLLEDTGALVGLVLALLGVGLATITGNGVYDGLGTVAIGLLLVLIAVILAAETKSLLVGESATPEDQRKIVAALEGGPSPVSVIHMKTLHLGPDEVLVAAKIAVQRGDTAEEIAQYIDDAERRIRDAVPIARVIYLEPDLRRPSAAVEPDAPATHGV